MPVLHPPSRISIAAFAEFPPCAAAAPAGHLAFAGEPLAATGTRLGEGPPSARCAVPSPPLWRPAPPARPAQHHGTEGNGDAGPRPRPRAATTGLEFLRRRCTPSPRPTYARPRPRRRRSRMAPRPRGGACWRVVVRLGQSERSRARPDPERRCPGFVAAVRLPRLTCCLPGGRPAGFLEGRASAGGVSTTSMLRGAPGPVTRNLIHRVVVATGGEGPSVAVAGPASARPELRFGGPASAGRFPGPLRLGRL